MPLPPLNYILLGSCSMILPCIGFFLQLGHPNHASHPQHWILQSQKVLYAHPAPSSIWQPTCLTPNPYPVCTLHTSTIVYFISGRVRILLCREPIQRSWEFYTGGADTDDEPTNFQTFNPILTDITKALNMADIGNTFSLTKSVVMIANAWKPTEKEVEK